MSDSKAKAKRQLGVVTANFIKVVNQVALHAERKVRAEEQITAIDQMLYDSCALDMDKLRAHVAAEIAARPAAEALQEQTENLLKLVPKELVMKDE